MGNISQTGQNSQDSADGSTRNWHVAIVGAGPAGLYAADALVKKGARVDIFERQFAPCGLVRYGVAPDHQKIKKTQVVFERILAQPGVRFFGAVSVGEHITVDELQEHYDQVLITMGSATARPLDIPGVALPGSTSATEFVNWYNGHPDFHEARYDLNHETAVVLGMGNVAIDVARILLRDRDELASTDIAPYALAALRASAIREVIVVARRGPNQAAFDMKEVRELAALQGIEIQVDGYTSKRKTPLSEFISTFPRKTATFSDKRVVLSFCESPAAVLGEGQVQGLRLERNDLFESAARMKAVGTGEFREIPCGLLVRAIGYHGIPLPGVPFDHEVGIIPNADGRVLSEQHGEVVPGLYVAGWIKRGPTGLIGTNKSCAVDTVALMEADLNQMGPLRNDEDLLQLLQSRNCRYISQEQWARLNEWELAQGAREGKVRSKITSLADALAVLDSAPG